MAPLAFSAGASLAMSERRRFCGDGKGAKRSVSEKLTQRTKSKSPRLSPFTRMSSSTTVPRNWEGAASRRTSRSIDRTEAPAGNVTLKLEKVIIEVVKSNPVTRVDAMTWSQPVLKKKKKKKTTHTHTHTNKKKTKNKKQRSRQ